MTKELKPIIGLEDILFVHYGCKKCGATLSIPLQTGKPAPNTPLRCPNHNCAEPWFRNEHDTRRRDLQNFVGYMADAKQILADLSSQGVTLDIRLELVPEKTQ